MNPRKPLIVEIYRSCFREGCREPEELARLRRDRDALEQRLSERLGNADGGEGRALLEQLLDCIEQIEALNCERYFREGYAYTLKFLAQGLC